MGIIVPHSSSNFQISHLQVPSTGEVPLLSVLQLNHHSSQCVSAEGRMEPCTYGSCVQPQVPDKFTQDCEFCGVTEFKHPRARLQNSKVSASQATAVVAPSATWRSWRHVSTLHTITPNSLSVSLRRRPPKAAKNLSSLKEWAFFGLYIHFWHLVWTWCPSHFKCLSCSQHKKKMLVSLLKMA